VGLDGVFDEERVAHVVVGDVVRHLFKQRQQSEY
jgi:hypothetical protein